MKYWAEVDRLVGAEEHVVQATLERLQESREAKGGGATHQAGLPNRAK